MEEKVTVKPIQLGFNSTMDGFKMFFLQAGKKRESSETEVLLFVERDTAVNETLSYFILPSS